MGRITNWIKNRYSTPVTLPDAPQDEAVPQPRLVEVAAQFSDMYSGRGGKIERYNPDLLRLRKGWDVYDRMLIDDQVKPVLRFKQYAVISRDWYFNVAEDEGGKKNEEQQRIADFFGAVIQRMRGSFSEKLVNVLSSLKYGYSVVEKIYEPIQWDDKAYWGIRDLKLRPAKSFDGGVISDQYGNVLELQQSVAAESIVVPMDKVVYYVHQSDVDPHYGESDLRACYRAWFSKDMAIRFQNIFLERHSGGFIWVEVPAGALKSDTQKTNLQNIMKNISAAMSAHVPEGVKLNAIQPMRTDAFEKAIAQHDKAIAKSLLVPNLLGLSEQGQTGSYSQSQTQFDAFLWVLDAIAIQLAEVLNEQLFRQLALWNFGTDDFPWFTWEPMTDEQKYEIAKAWTELVKGGSVSKSDTDEAWIRQLVGAPEKAEEEEPPLDDGTIPPNGEGGDEIIPPEEPDNEGWIAGMEPDRQEHVRKEFSERPWLRRVNFSKIEKGLNAQDTLFSDQLAESLGKARAAIEKQIVRVVGERSLGNVKPQEIMDIAIPKGVMSSLRQSIRYNLQAVLNESYEQAKKEIPKRKNAVAIREGMDKSDAERFLASKAMRIAGVIEADVLKGVQQALENAIRYDKTLKETIRSLSDDTNLVALLPDVDAGGRPINIPARLENIVRTNTADAMNTARMSFFGQPDFKGFVQAYEYSAILDDRVTDVCAQLDTRIRKDWGAFTPPNHYQCRSLLIPVTAIDEWGGQESRIPAGTEPQKGFK